jgi:hypothetical protein
MIYIDSIDDNTFSISSSDTGKGKVCYRKSYTARSVSVPGEDEPYIGIRNRNTNSPAILYEKFSEIKVNGELLDSAELAVKAINTQLGANVNPSEPPSITCDSTLVTCDSSQEVTVNGVVSAIREQFDLTNQKITILYNNL